MNDVQTLIDDISRFKGIKTKAKLIRPIVPIEKWVNDEYYVGPDVYNIYDFWKMHTIKIFNSPTKINEVIVTGSIGTGKSTFANLLLIRKLYEISCYENAQELFGLMLSTKIAFTYFNISKQQAEITGYGQLKDTIDSIPYFQEVFPRNDKKKNDIEFPKQHLYVYFGSGTEHVIRSKLIRFCS